MCARSSARRPTGTRSSDGSLRLRVALREVEPLVWRSLLVAASTPLETLHLALQATLGWWDCHLHEFEIGARRFSAPDPDDEMDSEDETAVPIGSLVRVGDSFAYTYDFGDGWEHDVKVEESLLSADVPFLPYCIGGERRCPPEDVGGPGGYADFLRAIGKPRSAEGRESLEWVGGSFDPSEFDLKQVNAALRRISRGEDPWKDLR